MNKKILVPVVTPLSNDETVNYEALQRLVEKLLNKGQTGFMREARPQNVSLLARPNVKRHWKQL